MSTGVSLPLKDEIVQIYNKFEELNKKVTEVLSNSNKDHIIFLLPFY